MILLILFISFIITLIFAILTIINAIKKKDFKRTGIIMLISALIFFASISYLGKEDEKPGEVVENTDDNKTVNIEDNKINNEQFVDYFVNTILDNNFKDSYYTSMDSDNIYINIWSDDLAEAVVYIAAFNKELIPKWDAMKESFSCMSENATKCYKEMVAVPNKRIVVNVLNEVNKDNVLLEYIDGECTYDCIDEYR